MHNIYLILYSAFLITTLCMSFYGWLYVREVSIVKNQLGITIPQPVHGLLLGLFGACLLASFVIALAILKLLLT